MLECRYDYILDLAPILLGVSIGIYFIKKLHHNDGKIPPVKIIIRLLKGLCTVFIGPFFCSFIYTYSSINSINHLIFYGILNYLITTELFLIRKFMEKDSQHSSSISKIELFLSLALFIIPSTLLYLVFLLFLNNFTIPL